MLGFAHTLINALQPICRGGRKSRALRELEMMDQSALNDLGMSRGALVDLCHGQKAGRCAAY